MWLIDGDVLYEQTAEWENQALNAVMKTKNDEDKTEWQKWSTILAERSAFKFDVADAPTVDAVPVVRCVECKYRYVDGDNVRFNLCLLNHNKVQSDDWYCADGRRKDAWEPNETDLKAMLDAGHETFVRVFSQDAKMNKEVESDAAD